MSERAVVEQSPNVGKQSQRPGLPIRAPLGGLLAMLATLTALATSAPAYAQAATDTATKEAPLKADFKGAVGCGLLGAELGFVIPALAGAKGVWPYIVFPLLGAGGGAVGGYFALEKGDGHPELAVGALTLGMALVVPAMVATIAATSYRPPEQIESARAKHFREVAQSGESLALAAPSIAVVQSQSARAALRTGVQRTSSLRVSLLSGRF